MIKRKELHGSWIQEVARKHKGDPLLIEKVVRALLLLEGLVKQGLSFVFKGGTALMLHFDSTRRLSIDIDIILPDKKVNMTSLLQAVVKDQGFNNKTRVAEQASP